MKRHTLSVLIAATVISAAGCQDPYTPPPAGVRPVLFIGSSATYWHDMPFVIQALTREADEERPLAPTVVARGGAQLDWHWNYGQARSEISRGGWEMVVIEQRYSADPQREAVLLQTTRDFVREIRRVKARPVLYLPGPDEASLDDDRAAAALDWQLRLAAEHGAVPVPVGEAFRAAARRDPGLVLREDDGHANLAGTYLAALTFYAALYGRAPLGAPARLELWRRNLDRIDLPPSTATVLQEAAAEAVARVR